MEISHYQVLFQSGGDNEMYPHGNLILFCAHNERKKTLKMSVVTQLLPNYQSFTAYHNSTVTCFCVSSDLQRVLFSHVCLPVPPLLRASFFPHVAPQRLPTSPLPRHISTLFCLHPFHSSSILTCIHGASVFSWQR